MPTTPTKVKGQWSWTGVRTRQEASLSRRKMYGSSYVSNTCQSSISLMERVETEVVSGPPHSGTDTLGSGLSSPLVPEALCPPVSCSALRGKSLRMTSAPGHFSTDASPAGTASIYCLVCFLWKKQQKTKFPTRLRPSVHRRSPWQFCSFPPDVRRLSGGSALRRTRLWQKEGPLRVWFCVIYLRHCKKEEGIY